MHKQRSVKFLRISFTRCWRHFFIFCLLMISSSLYGQETLDSLDAYKVPPDMSRVHFYLITVDVGDDVWNNFGHTALRLFDENINQNTIFNWGVFDTSGGVLGFSWDFFKGVMSYRLSVNSPSQEFASYAAQGRTVWQDKINLTNPQKEILYRRLMWNLEPANVDYPYQYFFDNCTTKVRDYLDEALSGGIRSDFTGQSRFTFRDHVQSHYQSVGFVGFSLDILMNSNIDRVISEWEEMFLPLKFREYLLQMGSNVAENGEQLMLLSEQQVVMEFPPPTIESDPYQVASVVLLSPVLFLFLMIRRVTQRYYATYSKFGLRGGFICWRLLGILGLIVMFCSGVYGLLMLGSWFVSDHVDTHHNMNLLLFWPTDILGAFVALRWLFLCEPWPTTHNNAPFINYYLLGHISTMLVYVFITAFGLSGQFTSSIALYLVPGMFLFVCLIWIVGFQPAKSKDIFF